MILKDSIYGSFQVEEVIEKLINTNEVQRLKKIHQGGASYLVNSKWNVTRYEHSVGVMLLVRLLGGSIQEQMAGLLHDISHTAFSHVIDYVLKKENEDYHEDIFEVIVENSEIPSILESYGYDYKDILYNEEKWTILEKSAPKLCADRIDYTLRDMYEYGFITKNEVDKFLENILLINGEIIINSIEVSEWFVEVYYKEVIGFFMNPLNIYGNNKLSNILVRALELNVIKEEDFLKEDDYVYNLLKQSKTEEILNSLVELESPIKLIEDKISYDIYQKNKVRLVDPIVKIKDDIYISSSKSAKIQNMNHDAALKSQEGIFIKILK